MTKKEFYYELAKLCEAYATQLTPATMESYWYELGTYDLQDLQETVRRVPANEPKGLPSAKCLKDYILDAQETRKLAIRKDHPSSFRDLVQKTPDKDLPFAKLIVSFQSFPLYDMEKRPMPEHGRARCALIDAFRRDHAAWLAVRPETQAWLQGKYDEYDRVGKSGTLKST